MSVASELYTLMIGDSSINGQINGAIQYENLPDNFDIKKKWILYYYRVTDQTNTLTGKNAFQTSDLTVIIMTQNSADLVTISDLVISYLNGKSTTNIIDIAFVSDGHSVDIEKGLYINELTFNMINK